MIHNFLTFIFFSLILSADPVDKFFSQLYMGDSALTDQTNSQLREMHALAITHAKTYRSIADLTELTTHLASQSNAVRESALGIVKLCSSHWPRELNDSILTSLQSYWARNPEATIIGDMFLSAMLSAIENSTQSNWTYFVNNVASQVVSKYRETVVLKGRMRADATLLTAIHLLHFLDYVPSTTGKELTDYFLDVNSHDTRIELIRLAQAPQFNIEHRRQIHIRARIAGILVSNDL